MKAFLSALVALSTLGFASAPFAATAAQPAAATSHPAMSTTETTIGDLLDNKDARAVLEKHLPAVVQSDQIEMARSMTLRQIQAYAPDDVTDAKLAEIDTALAALPQN